MGVIRRTRQAAGDLIDIWTYVAERNRAAADRIVLDLNAKAGVLSDDPEIGRRRPELMNDLRSFPFRRYVIFYRPIDDRVLVLRVVHGARDLSSLSFAPDPD